MFNKRSVGSTHSSHGNLSQASITSCDVLSGDEADAPLNRHAKISERRSNSSTDIQGAHTVTDGTGGRLTASEISHSRIDFSAKASESYIQVLDIDPVGRLFFTTWSVLEYG